MISSVFIFHYFGCFFSSLTALILFFLKLWIIVELNNSCMIFTLGSSGYRNPVKNCYWANKLFFVLVSKTEPPYNTKTIPMNRSWNNGDFAMFCFIEITYLGVPEARKYGIPEWRPPFKMTSSVKTLLSIFCINTSACITSKSPKGISCTSPRTVEHSLWFRMTPSSE